MKKLLYNIYTNISDSKFLSIEKQMVTWEYKMSTVLFPLNWRKTKSVIDNDALIVDFIKRTSKFYGNTGIVFEDQVGKISFALYVTKSFDEGNIRYFLREYIFEDKEMGYFENQIEKFTKEALELYNSWDREIVISRGEKYEIN